MDSGGRLTHELRREADAGLRRDRIVVPPTEASSSAAHSLVRLQIGCAGQNLCTGHDDGGHFDALEVPLIDLATWLVEGWDERVFGTRLHDVLATSFRYGVPVAARWELSAALGLRAHEAESLHAWASIRAVEIAATDYLLPNIVFDRVDDFMRVSWSQRAKRHPFVDLAFAPSQGAVLLDVRDFVALCLSLVRATFEWTRNVGGDDTRVAQIAEFLERDPEPVGRDVVERWVPGLDAGAAVPTPELVQLAQTGRGGLVAAFLRSSDGVLAAGAVAECLRLFSMTGSRLDRSQIEGITTGADTTIQPTAPWESGLHLARHVRARLAHLGVCPLEGPVPIEDLVAGLGVAVHPVDLGTPAVDGVCFMDETGRALAILNTAGRLASRRAGRRSTLAHELCHFAFDAPRYQTIGQADPRAFPDSVVEKRANAFAAELLLPRSVVREYAGRGHTLGRDRLRRLANRFGVGMKLAEHQAVNAGVRITEP